jgi:Xaa-Pro aminopeptidase
MVVVAAIALVGLSAAFPPLSAGLQPVFLGSEVFPQEEFAARRAKVIAEIGDGVAIVLGTAEPPGEVPFRQNSQFFYLTGVVEPRAIAIIDGRSKETTLFLKPKDVRREQSGYGPALSPGPEAAMATGIANIQPREQFSAAVTALTADRRTIYTPFAAEVLSSQSQGDPTRMWAANKQDPWDGRDSREATFVEKLKAAAPPPPIKDLDPIVNGLRAVKSPREIAVIREATRIAGLGIMEGMRDAKPGMAEYELQADCEFVFKKNGAYGAAYFALIATGRNTYYTHYNRNTSVLADGDLVQLDYAPDFKYYQSDVTRVFPANGKFTARQRELYTVYLKLYQAIMTSIKVHASTMDVKAEAGRKMDAIIASYKFTDDKIRTAAINMAAPFHAPRPGGLGHAVGMEVHDVGGAQATLLEPGRIFTIEPQLRLEDEHLGVRLEDMLLITETGYENLSAFVPIEIADIEKLMAEPGLSDARRGGRQY